MHKTKAKVEKQKVKAIALLIFNILQTSYIITNNKSDSHAFF